MNRPFEEHSWLDVSTFGSQEQLFVCQDEGCLATYTKPWPHADTWEEQTLDMREGPHEVHGEVPPLAGLVCEHGYRDDHVLYTAGKVSGHCGPTTGPVYYRDEPMQRLCEGYTVGITAAEALAEAILRDDDDEV